MVTCAIYKKLFELFEFSSGSRLKVLRWYNLFLLLKAFSREANFTTD